MSINYGPTVIAEPVSFITTGQTLNIVYNGDSATMTKVGSDSWDTQAYSSTPFTAPCTIEFNKSAGTSGDNGVSYTMVGWNNDPITDASYSSIDWAAYPFRTDQYQVYNNNAQSVYGAWDSSKKFYLVYDLDGVIRHYNGSTLLVSFNKGTGQTVFFDSSFYSGNPFGSLRNVRLIRRSWNGSSYV